MKLLPAALICFLIAVLVLVVPSSGWFSSAPVVVGTSVEQPTEWIAIVAGKAGQEHKFSVKATHARLLVEGMQACVEFTTNGRVTAGFCDLIAFGKEEK